MARKIIFGIAITGLTSIFLVIGLLYAVTSYAETRNLSPDRRSVSSSSARMQTTGAIAGLVTDQEDRPLVGISVQVDQSAPGTTQGYTQTNSSGLYQIDNILPGTYRVLFFGGTNYVAKAVLDVAVTANGVNTVNVKLDRTSHITGTVTDKDGNPLAGISVTTYVPIPQSNAWYPMPPILTDKFGRYDASGLSPNTYRIGFFGTDHAYAFYGNVDNIYDATSIVVGTDETITNINAQLADAGYLTGTVTDMLGNPIFNSVVTLYRRKNDSFVQHYIGHGTNLAGRYRFDGLPAGVYRAYFSGGNGQHFPEYYDNSQSLDNATDIIVTAGVTVTNINAQLLAPGAFTNCQQISGIPAAECDALVAFYNSANGANWTNKTGWLNTNAPCSWYGVSCTSGHVVTLQLSQNQLAGPLPVSLNALTSLKWLILHRNQLTGAIPPALGSLATLRGLNLWDNQLTGPIPVELTALSNLESLILSSNQLTGEIPTQFGNLTHLTTLHLSDNQFTGSLPASLSNLVNLRDFRANGNTFQGALPSIAGATNLETLELADNQFTGLMPAQWNSLTQLRKLTLAGNQLTGPLPTWLGNFTLLEELRLDGNHFDAGPIPAEFANLTALTGLDLSATQRTGQMPSWIGNLTHLQELYLLDNELEGSIPHTIGQLTNLQVLHLANNSLTEGIPAEIGDALNLEEIYLDNNQLSGSLPTTLGNLTKLRELWLWHNQLQGQIPVELMNLAELRGLGLFGNQLTGPLPSGWQNLTKLEDLGLAANPIGGTIPPEIGNLVNLRTIYWEQSQLTGEIPASFSNLVNLEELILNNNQLRGPLPTYLGALTKLRKVALHHNQLAGPIPVSFGNLINLEDLALSDNPLTGTIPPELGNLTKLRTLSLYSAQLTGTIPASLGQLTNLEEFYGWSNQLSGPLPPALGNLTKLEQLDLANNQLEGDLLAEFGNLTQLTRLAVNLNRLSGLVPGELGNLINMERMYLQDNQLSGPLPAQLNALTKLINFHFYHNDLCEPTDAAMQNWLDSIPYLESTGLPCGATPGHIAGIVTDATGNNLANIAVTLQRNTKGSGWNVWRTVAGTTTAANGAYHFDGLGNVGYSLFFADPSGQYGAEYHNNAGTLDRSTTVTATLGATITVNAVLDAPVPPAIVVTTTSGNLATDTKTGTVTIAMPRPNKSAITITRAVTCPNTIPSTVELLFTVGDNTQSYIMSPTAPAPNYQATIPAADLTGNGALAIKLTCSSNSTTTDVGSVQLYDPSGRITDAATGQPIINATVTLYNVPGWHPKQSATDARADTCESNKSKTAGAPWSQSAPTTIGVLVNPELGIISPAVNHMQTNTDGRYGWDVAEGCWYVVVTAPGYTTKISPVVGVPPAVTDLDLQMVKATVEALPTIYLPLIRR